MTPLGFVIGLGIIVFGVYTLKNNYSVTNNFNKMYSLEKILGPGSEYGVYKFISLIIILVGFTVMFGVWDDMVNFLTAPLKTLLVPRGDR